MLPTKVHKMYTGNDKTCPRCGVYEEIMKHVIFECSDIYYTDDELLCRLGLRSEQRYRSKNDKKDPGGLG